MSSTTKINLSDSKAYQATGQTLTLSGHTKIATVGDLKYVTHPTFSEDTQIIDKKYVDDSVVSTGSTIYNLATPSTVTIGGLTSGTILTGKTSNEILKEILVMYLLPAFSSFCNNVSTPLEVGTTISGSKSFTFGFTNAGNVCANTLSIRDVSVSSNIATACPISSPQSATINAKTFVSCGNTQVWCGCATNTCGAQIGSSSYTITGLLPYYWGVCTCPGAAGAGRPTATCAMVTGGTKILASSEAISINFNSGVNDYLWFAIPATVAAKTCWCVNGINNGTIGGCVSPACNLFPAPNSISVTTACWSGCNYNVYISNKQTCATLSMSLT
jgi:hypothetical protein